MRRRILLGQIFTLSLALTALGCGSSGGVSNPDRPDPVITAEAQFVDVGQRFVLSAADSTEPGDRELSFAWRVTGSTVEIVFEDHCVDDFDQICTSNDDDTCLGDTSTFCTSDADCGAAGICNFNSGTTSSQCDTGACLVGGGDDGTEATFVASVPGPFEVRLTAESDIATNIATRIFDTYPSLYLVGSLTEFGGTDGGLVGAVEDADDFTPNAIVGVANPVTGNLLVVDDELDVVREFSIEDNSIIGDFGDVARFATQPAVLVFDSADRLNVIDDDGTVRVFDADNGLLIRVLGNVGPVEAGRAGAAFSEASGELLVVNGGAGVQRFSASGAALGALGDTVAATTEAVDLTFSPDGDLLIADAIGDVVRCDDDGSNCESLGEVASELDPGSPSAIAVNPSFDDRPDVALLVADPGGERVIACDIDGFGCSTFGETDAVSSDFHDVVFAPSSAPTTTTSSTTSTTLL